MKNLLKCQEIMSIQHGTTGIIYEKVLFRIITLSSTEKTFIINPLIGNVKRYDEIRKLTTVVGEDYTTGCLLEYKIIID